MENAACARRLFASADELERMLAADGSEERQQWCLANWGAVAASVAAAQNVSLGVAAHQLLIADSLRRLPRVAEVFAAGAINYRLIAAIVNRTRLIKGPDALAKGDTEIAAQVEQWGVLSAEKTQTQIDYWVHRYDPAAVRRTEFSARGRHVEVRDPEDGSGMVWVEGKLIDTDAAALDHRLDAMACTVCDGDPRTLEQRRADALGALGHGADRLVCGCDNPDCDAAGIQPSAVVVHAMPRRKTTRAQNHIEAIDDDRRFNQTLIQAEADERARNRECEDPGNGCDDLYFPTRPPPPRDDDPPSF